MDNINPEALDELRRRAKILEVVSDHVTMKGSDTSYMGRCPFHDEDSPSFSVRPDKRRFQCFGCGQKGDVFTFVMKIKSTDFRGAVKHLATKYGIDPNLGAID